MQFPDFRVGCRGEQRFPIVNAERSKLQQITHEMRLQIQCVHFTEPILRSRNTQVRVEPASSETSAPGKLTVPRHRHTFVPMFGRALSGFVFTLVLCFGFVAARGSDWPQFRGPDGQGHADVRLVPTAWGTTNIVWQTKIPGSGWSSPILQRERIFLTTAVPVDGGQQSLRTLCLDTHSGKMVWSTELFAAVPQAGHKKNSHASATPITD